MRILLLPGLGIKPSVGGQGSFCRYLVAGLRDRGDHVVIGSDDPEWARFGMVESVEVQPSPHFRAAEVVHFNSKNLKGMARALLAGRPIVVTNQGYHLICPAVIAYAPLGCSAGPRAGPCQNCPRRDLRARLDFEAYRVLAASRSVHHVGISECVRRRLGYQRSSAILSPQPVLTPPDVREDDRLLAFAGRLAPEKGLDLLLRALAHLPGVRVEVAGDGRLRAELEQLAVRLGVAHRVQFLGPVPLEGIYELYTRAAAVVVPSVYDEPFGYSAAEAMALGRATIASNAGAFQEMLSDERGWLCSTTDISDWVKAIGDALAQPAERRRRGARAREFVARVLSPSHVAERYHAVYIAASRDNGRST